MIELGNSFFESKKQTFLLQSYQRDSKNEKRHSFKIRSGPRFSRIDRARLTLLPRRAGPLQRSLGDAQRS
jgi:hypothetical protein